MSGIEMPLTEELKHFDDVVDDVMRSLEACTTVQQTIVAKALGARFAGDDDILAAIRELISDPDFPARQLAELASRLMLPRYRYNGDSLFSVMHGEGPDFQEFLASRDLGAATIRFLEIARSGDGTSMNLSEDQAREIVKAIMPSRSLRS